MGSFLGGLLSCLTQVNGLAYVAGASIHAGGINVRMAAETAIQVALVGAQWYVNNSISKDQEALGKRRISLAEKVLAHAQQYWPHERGLLQDAFNAPDPYAEYSQTESYATGRVNNVYAYANADFQRRAKRRCSTVVRLGARWDRNHALSSADTLTFGFRHDEYKRDIMDDVLFSHRYTALGIGKGMLNTVNAFGNISANAGMTAGRVLADSIQSSMEALGYFGLGGRD